MRSEETFPATAESEEENLEMETICPEKDFANAVASYTDDEQVRKYIAQQLCFSINYPDGDYGPLTSDKKWAAKSIMEQMAPRDPLEAMLVSQMIVTHDAATTCISKETTRRVHPDQGQFYYKQGIKFLELFGKQLSLFDKRRGVGRTQKIRVERVNVNEGGQAIVAGTVNTKPNQDE